MSGIRPTGVRLTATGVRLTATGIGAASGGVVLFVSAVLFGWTELAWLGAASLTAVLLGLTTVVVLDRSLAASHHIRPARVSVGQPSVCVVEFGRSPSHLTPVSISEVVAGRAVEVVATPGDSTVELTLPTDRRGVYTVGPLSSVRTDSMALVSRRRRLAEGVELIVHPRVWPLDRDPGSRSMEMDGPTVEEQISGSDTFHRLREYTPGDEPRHIHWPASAHTGQLMVRHFVDTARPEVAVVLDDLETSHRCGEELDQAVEVVASLLVGALAADAPVQFSTLSGHSVRVDRGSAPVDLLDQLAAVVPAHDVCHDELQRLPQRLAGSTCLVVTGHGAGSADASASLLSALQQSVRGLDLLTVGSGVPPRVPVSCRVSTGATAPQVLQLWTSGAPR